MTGFFHLPLESLHLIPCFVLFVLFFLSEPQCRFFLLSNCQRSFIFLCINPDYCSVNLWGLIHSAPNHSHHFWTSSVIFPTKSPSSILRRDYPFHPNVIIFPTPSRACVFVLKSEWPLLVGNAPAGNNNTSLFSLGDIKREISLALATLWQTLSLGAIFTPCSLCLHFRSSTSQQVGLVSLLHMSQ